MTHPAHEIGDRICSTRAGMAMAGALVMAATPGFRQRGPHARPVSATIVVET